ncbi:MAG TPA: WD40 repeat domain-containing protein, partial [Gemmataceae bacterium]
MNTRGSLVLLLALALLPSSGRAQAPAANDPLLRLEADGPTSFVTALAFDPDGETLYAAGYDKVVRVWTLNKTTNQFVLDRPAAYRVPIGPELQGVINALVVSPDGKWLAAAGSGVVRKSAGFGVAGMIFPGRPRDAEMLLDEGRIYVYDRTTRKLTVLRGHKGEVLSMAFAPSQKDKPPILVSTALEFDRKPTSGEGTVRVWNVDTGKEYVAAATNQPNRNTRVGLAVWYTDTKAAELRVAYAWGDGKLRVWDVDGGRLDERQRDGLDDTKFDSQRMLNHNNTLVRWEQQKTFITGSLEGTSGQLRQWNIPAGSGPSVEAQPLRRFPVTEAGLNLPRALSLVSSAGNGRPDYAAVVMRTDPREGAKTEERYSLRLIGLAGADSGKEVANVRLWNGGASLPALATTANKKFLAVAGNKEHEIRIYLIPDLFKHKIPWQSLHSVGEELPSANFVRRGKDSLGVVLRQSADRKLTNRASEPVPGELVFDLTSRTLQTHTLGSTLSFLSPDPLSALSAAIAFANSHWRADGPDLEDADVKWARDDKGIEIVTVRIGRDTKQITFGSKQRVTKCALLPALPPPAAVKIPLLAVAFTEDGLPRLYLYNGLTGEQIRQCSGHTDPIRSLAFSSDGKLLVSAAED